MDPSRDHRALRQRLDAATAELDPPFAVVDLNAFDHNATRMRELADSLPIRLAAKSIRCRDLLRRALARDGYRGVMAYTLAEALWLAAAEVSHDILVGYPSVDRAALRELAADERAAAAVTVMVDSIDQLDYMDSVLPKSRPELRVCLDLDASWRLLGGRVHLGVRRSPVHSAAQAGRLAVAVAGRTGFKLVGVMAYEAQIAGVGQGSGPKSAAVRLMQRRSFAELRLRRAASVAAVRRVADLEFVNGGGTGSLSLTATDSSVTELTAGSGLYGPVLFDAYDTFRPRPAAGFALSVVRRPGPGVATLHGGGWIASGQSGRSRLPKPWLPAGLRLLAAEGAGEVQTPVRGPGVSGLRVGDRVWLRHAKAGELCERVNELHLISGDAEVAAIPTYRGEGRAFL